MARDARSTDQRQGFGSPFLVFASRSGISFSSLPRASVLASLPSASTANTVGIELIPQLAANSLAETLPS